MKAKRTNTLQWLGFGIWLAASIVVAQERPAAAITLDTYLQRNPGVSGGQGAVRLDSNTGAGSQITGSWSGSAAAPAMFQRGVAYQTAQIVPVGSGVTPVSRTHRVSWQYSFLSAPPAGARAYLCNYARCVALDGASGSTTAFAGDSGWSNFAFAFVIAGRGALTPALQGSGSQVIVNYQ